MFVDVTKPERSDILSQTEGCLMPGYTGHCPTLKFRFGKRYGANTKEIIQELSDRGILKRHLTVHYRVQDPLRPILPNGKLSPIIRTKDQLKEHKVDSSNRCRRYILGYTEHHISPEFPPIAGYTGHIPRLRGTEASLSQRFHTAAKRGLSLLQQERETKRNMEEAQNAVQIALMNSQPRYTTPIR